jgi:hypothetical protein
MIAEAVCQTGWCLSSKAACALASSWVYEFAPASGHGFRSTLWGVAALLSDPREWRGSWLKRDGRDALTGINRRVTWTTQLAMFDAALAAQLPAEFELLNWLHW